MLWLRADTDDLQVAQGIDHFTHVVFVDFFGLFLQPIQLPVVAAAGPGELISFFVGDSAHGVDDGTRCLQLTQIRTAQFQQIRLDPVAELCRQVDINFGPVSLFFISPAYVVGFAALVLYLLANDQIDELRIAFSFHDQTLAAALKCATRLVKRIDDAVSCVIRFTTALQCATADSDD